MTSAVTVAGRATRHGHCERHHLDFLQFWFPPIKSQPGFWVPSKCGDCAKDAELEQRADELVRGQVAEIESEARQLIAQREKEIARRVKRELAKDVAIWTEERRPILEGWVRGCVWDEITWELSEERKSKITAELRETERAARTVPVAVGG